jgi:hypothetical protein
MSGQPGLEDPAVWTSTERFCACGCGGDVDGGVLPHGGLGPGQPTDADAVQLHKLTWVIDLEVPLR